MIYINESSYTSCIVNKTESPTLITIVSYLSLVLLLKVNENVLLHLTAPKTHQYFPFLKEMFCDVV